MASASPDQQNALLPSDERSPSVAPAKEGLPITKIVMVVLLLALVVGFCVKAVAFVVAVCVAREQEPALVAEIEKALEQDPALEDEVKKVASLIGARLNGVEYCETAPVSADECERSACCESNPEGNEKCYSDIEQEICDDTAESQCPEDDTSAIRISNHRDNAYNGVYLQNKEAPWNGKPHYVKDNKFHFYHFLCNASFGCDGDVSAVYQLDDRDQSSECPHPPGNCDFHRGGSQKHRAHLTSGEDLWKSKDGELFTINIECTNDGDSFLV